MQPIRVDFYLIESTEPKAHWVVACRLIEKAYYKGHKIFVFCDHQKDAELIDELLWTFRDESFIPHNLQGEGPEPPPPVQIGYDKKPARFNDVLVNLATTPPLFFNQFKRVLELVANDAAKKEQSRRNYKQYKAAGCELNTHEIAEV